MKGTVGQAAIGQAALLGVATISSEQAGRVDPLDPARAVRRCLADAHVKAAHVEHIVVAHDLAPEADDLAMFVRLALGSRGAAVAAAAPQPNVIGAIVSALRPDGGLGIAVLHGEATTIALCVRHADAPRTPQSLVK